MEMDYFCGPSQFMQFIDVLCDDYYIICGF
jgi:hypothetical protein